MNLSMAHIPESSKRITKEFDTIQKMFKSVQMLRHSCEKSPMNFHPLLWALNRSVARLFLVLNFRTPAIATADTKNVLIFATPPPPPLVSAVLSHNFFMLHYTKHKQKDFTCNKWNFSIRGWGARIEGIVMERWTWSHLQFAFCCCVVVVSPDSNGYFCFRPRVEKMTEKIKLLMRFFVAFKLDWICCEGG